jgi:hypothetical protein
MRVSPKEKIVAEVFNPLQLAILKAYVDAGLKYCRCDWKMY